MMRTINDASEQYRNAIRICREIFTAAGRAFTEPKGVAELIGKARELYTVQADEAAAVKEVENAEHWLNGIAVKFLRGGVEFFNDKIVELSYLSLDDDIMERMREKLRDFDAAVALETGDCFELRIETYKELAAAVNGARAEQFRRIEESEQRALAEAEEKERERVRLRKEQEAAEAKRREEEAAAARAKREKQFDELFA